MLSLFLVFFHLVQMISLQILNVFCVLMALSYYAIDTFVLYYNDISILHPQKLIQFKIN